MKRAPITRFTMAGWWGHFMGNTSGQKIDIAVEIGRDSITVLYHIHHRGYSAYGKRIE